MAGGTLPPVERACKQQRSVVRRLKRRPGDAALDVEHGGTRYPKLPIDRQALLLRPAMPQQSLSSSGAGVLVDVKCIDGPHMP
jgi:hypothetical protein